MKLKKKVPITSFNIGDSFETYIDGDVWHMGLFTICDKVENGYMVQNYSPNPEFVPNSAMVEIKYTEKEINDKYEQQVIELIRAVNNKLYDQGDAIHEMWNGWIWEPSPGDMVVNLEANDLKVIGYFELNKQQRAGYMDLDIGIVAEYIDTGDRIWCHTKRGWYQSWKRDFPDLWEKAMEE